jgi:cephalosporin hydroxylase
MESASLDPLSLPFVAAQAWQMSYGERAALEGIVSQVAPKLAVEIGTAEGGSLKRIAAHSDEVHSFDLVPPVGEVAQLQNVTFHTGDSHTLLSAFLERIAGEQRSIDFVLVDGDHSADGVRLDVLDILNSDAVSRAVVVLHDTLNPEVRLGIESAQPAGHPKVALNELDLVPGYSHVGSPIACNSGADSE